MGFTFRDLFLLAYLEPRKYLKVCLSQDSFVLINRLDAAIFQDIFIPIAKLYLHCAYLHCQADKYVILIESLLLASHHLAVGKITQLSKDSGWYTRRHAMTL